MSRITGWGSLVVLGILVVWFGVRGTADPGRPVEKAVPATPAAECRWTATPITIDGKLDEAAWGKAQVIDGFAVFWEKRPPRTATSARLLWDDKYLYFAAEME